MKMDDLKLPIPLTNQRLLAMKVGDTFESEGLFQGVSPEPVVWHLSTMIRQKKKDEGEYVFMLTYFGVKIGEVCVWGSNKTIRVEAL
jgi:hypothetical protein